MDKSKQATKVKSKTTKIGSGESRSKSSVGEFTVGKNQQRGETDERKSVRTEYEITGTTGHVTKCKSVSECLNFIQLVFKRKVDHTAFKADKLEFIDDGQLSRAEKSKLETVNNQLNKLIEIMDGIKRICLTGDIGAGTLNQNVFNVIDDSETSVDKKIEQITDMIAVGRESQFWKS